MTAPADEEAPAPAATTMRRLREEIGLLLSDLPAPPSRVSVRAGTCRMEIEWAVGAAVETATVPAGSPDSRPDAALAAESDSLSTVSSPMVGTFYRAPEPGARPFVEIGDHVEAGQTVAIIEAMKLMNHIVCEHTGTVREIHVDDGGPVEFEQRLISVDPTR